MISAVGVALAAGCLARVGANSRAAQAAVPSPASRLWITAGGGFTSLKGDCSTCTGEPVYRKTGSLLINVGARASDQLDAGLEVHWMPAHRNGYDIRTTFLMGWVSTARCGTTVSSSKAGWASPSCATGFTTRRTTLTPPFTTNAMALTYGGGWEFRSSGRVGLQIFGSHSVVALGDLNVTGGSTVENVVGQLLDVRRVGRHSIVALAPKRFVPPRRDPMPNTTTLETTSPDPTREQLSRHSNCRSRSANTTLAALKIELQTLQSKYLNESARSTPSSVGSRPRSRRRKSALACGPRHCRTPWTR